MSNFSYDELYGIDINKYCELHSISLEELIEKVNIDISILKRNLHNQTYKEPPNWCLINEIAKLLDKKEKHLKRLKKWKSKNE
jgi:hypothetical protein